MKIKSAFVLAAICAVLAIPGTAFAGSPTKDAYSGVAGVHQSGGNTPSTQVDAAAVESAPVSEQAVQSAGGTLPFTGLEVGMIALVGVVLLGGGAVLYRVNRRAEHL